MNSKFFNYGPLAAALLLTACGGDSGGGGSDSAGGGNDICATSNTAISCATVDATSYDDWVYYNLANKAVVESPSGNNWHIAFQRYTVKLNSGVSGTGGAVGGFVAYSSPELYPDGADEAADADAVMAAKASDTQAYLTSADLSLPANAGAWKVDDYSSLLSPKPVAIEGGGWDYGWFKKSNLNQLTANPDRGGLLRSAGANSFARLRLASIEYADAGDTSSPQTWKFEIDVHPVGSTKFNDTTDEWSVQLPSENDEVCYDFDDKTEIADCSGTDWDLKLKTIDGVGTLWTNSGTSGDGDGGSIGGPNKFSWDYLKEWTRGNRSPTDTTTIPDLAWLADRISSVFAGSNGIGSYVFEYDLSGQRLMWPSHRVFLITTDSTKDHVYSNADGTKVYALQIISYYGGPAGTTSGHVTFRWLERTAP